MQEGRLQKQSHRSRRAFVAAALALSLSAIVGSSVVGCAHLLFPLEERATEVIYVETEDGWRIALHHFPAADSAPKRRHPVLVCHGITSNRHNWDLTERLSFPTHIAKQGFDTWVMELRGSGLSTKPGWFDERNWNYNFDDYVLQDLPTAIDFVASLTQTGKVHWVGHSMGSMIVYAYLQRLGEEKIQSVTAVGAPPRVFDSNHLLTGSYELLPLADWVYDELPSGFVTALAAPFSYPAFIPLAHMFWNYDNVSPQTARLAAAHAVENLSATVLVQFVASARSGFMTSVDGIHNYSHGLGSITVPIFFVAGALDQLAPPVVMMEAFSSVSSSDKRIEVLSRANGYAHDYGHVDLVLGDTAPDEVYPMLARWVVEHD